MNLKEIEQTQNKVDPMQSILDASTKPTPIFRTTLMKLKRDPNSNLSRNELLSMINKFKELLLVDNQQIIRTKFNTMRRLLGKKTI